MSKQGLRDYSGTPLPRKLGMREGSRVLLVNPPEGLEDLLAPLPTGVEILSRPGRDLDVIVLFANRSAELDRRFGGLATRLAPDGRLWVAWPKRASGVETDLTFELVQRKGLSAGLVDNKSASMNDVFQGLQFVFRLRDRPAR